MNKQQWKAIYDFCNEYGYDDPLEVLKDLRKKQVIDKYDGWYEIDLAYPVFTYEGMTNFLTENLL